MDTSWYEIVDLAVLPENLLDGDSTTDEETEDETEKTSGVGTLCSVEVQKISDDSARSTDVPDVTQHSEGQCDQETSACGLYQLLDEFDDEFRVSIVVLIPGVE
mgnify:CR=1 FL=1